MPQELYPPVVQGDVAHDSPNAGQPLQVGGKVTTGSPTAVTDGDRVAAWYGGRGETMVSIIEKGAVSGSAVSVGQLSSDANGLVVGLYVHARPQVFNGTNWDRMRGGTLGIDIARAAAAATSAVTSVSGSASSVTLLASNTARKGATIYNDSSAILYVKFGATASTTSYTVQVAAGGYFEAPFGYTGVIDGIWASATGDARITELT